MSDTPDRTSEEEADSALREGLQARGLSAEALQRIRRAAEAEWRANLEPTEVVAPRPRAWLKIAAAASVVLLAGASVVGVINYNRQSEAGALVATVGRSEAPGIELRQLLRADEPMRQGAGLRVNARLDVRGDSLLELAGGGNLRVARGSSVDIPDASTVRLESG